MKKVFHIPILVSSLLLLIACVPPAEEVAIDFVAKAENRERIKLLAEAQFAKEEFISLAQNQEEYQERSKLAKSSEKQILSTLTRSDQKFFQELMLKHRLELDNFNRLINPAQTAFYQDLPTIKGVTIDVPSHFFNVDLILAYDANERRLSSDISSARLAIADRLRNLLMQYPANAFMQGREELLREPMQQAINETLAKTGSPGRINHIFITRFEVYEIPN